MRVGIIGAGPAGTSCAISLLRGSRQRGQTHEVLLFDGKSFDCIGPLGCNMCAGVIPISLFNALGIDDLRERESVIQRYISGHYYQTQVGGIHIPSELGVTLCTVFRSAGPRGSVPDTAQSFDSLLLRAACNHGARYMHAFVTDVRLPEKPDAPFHIFTRDGGDVEVDVLVGAFGVNSALCTHFEALGFGFRRPRTYHVCQAEIPLDPEYIDATYGDECQIFSLGLRGIRFGAIVPKRRHVTVTIIGRNVKRADLERFLQQPTVKPYFPEGWQCPESYCHCYPQLPVGASRHVVHDRLMIIGDAHIARYLKGGIESAFFTGSHAAEAILSGALTQQALTKGFVRACAKKYAGDNVIGRLLFFWNDLLSHVTPATRVALWLLKQEQRMPKREDRVHTRLLWNIFAGDASYRQILVSAFSCRSLLAVMHTIVHSVSRRIVPALESGESGQPAEACESLRDAKDQVEQNNAAGRGNDVP